MNRINISVCILLIFVSFRSIAQQNGFEIGGHLEGLEEGGTVYLYPMGDYEHFTVDTCIVKNGSFFFKGIATDGPRIYELQLTGKEERTARLCINNGEKIVVTCDSSLQKIRHSVIGSFLQYQNGRCQIQLGPLLRATDMYVEAIGAVNASMRRMRDSIGFDPHLMEMFLNQRKQLAASLYMGILNDDAIYDVVIPVLIVGGKLHQADHHSSYAFYVYKRLSEKAKNTFYGKLFQKYSAIAEGQPFPSFTLPTQDGGQLSCKDIFPKGKLTIIHFWTSNSIDKTKYQDELKFFYKKYHDKGLNVIGVYAGKYIDSWKEDLKDGAYPWYNVADLKGKDGPCQQTYLEPAFPNPNDSKLLPDNTTNVLVDANGNIVAWDARELELEYYLWKKFEQ